MGCCSTNMVKPKGISASKFAKFTADHKMNTISVNLIQRIPEGIFTKITYTELAKELGFQVPYEVLSGNDNISSFDLKAGLLLLSSDPANEKVELFKKIAQSDRQKMRFFELKYQLINDKLPKFMINMRVVESEDLKKWVDVHRCIGAEVIIKEWNLSKSEKIEDNGSLFFIINNQ